MVGLFWVSQAYLGDKSNHNAMLHLPQIFYFASFTSFFGIACMIIPISKTAKSLICGRYSFKSMARIILFFTIAGLISLVLVRYTTFEHPFMLADNRHYIFYIWKDIYRAHQHAKYILVPLYIAAVYFVLNTLGTHCLFRTHAVSMGGFMDRRDNHCVDPVATD